MQILKIVPQLSTQRTSPLRNQGVKSTSVKMFNVSDTVAFQAKQPTAVIGDKTQKLLTEVLDKLNLKNLNMSRGYSNAVRNDTEVKAYYENTENLITHIRKLFSQTPDGKIVTFEKIDGVDAPDEFRIEKLVPMKNNNKYTGIHITEDKTFFVTGEMKELDAPCQRPSHTVVNTKEKITQFNKTAQECLSELLSDKNIQF